MPLLRADDEGIARAAAVLRCGGTVAFPTETVYGLGALAFDARAAAAIFEIKKRPSFDPLIVHVLDHSMLERVVYEIPPLAQRVIDRFWPGPLTLVLAKHAAVPDIVTAGLPTVAVRMPSHPTARSLLRAVGAPIAAPSANSFGRLSPTSARHVFDDLGERVALILDAGPCERGIESTIVAFEPQLTLLRPGALTTEELEAVTGALAREPEDAPARAPGRLAQHYAPRTALRLIEPATVSPGERSGAAALTLRAVVEGYDAVGILSHRGDLREAAARFFETLHQLDSLGVARIDAQPLPENGLGLAMMDRLRRAAGARNT